MGEVLLKLLYIYRGEYIARAPILYNISINGDAIL